jgi:hypothetical protein
MVLDIGWRNLVLWCQGDLATSEMGLGCDS